MIKTENYTSILLWIQIILASNKKNKKKTKKNKKNI